MTLDILFFFRLVGLAMVGLLLANFIAAKRLSYAQNLAQSDLLVRQIFYVHCGYIMLLIAGLGFLCLGWPHLLLEGAMGRVVCYFFGVFWASRVVVQLTYYDPERRREERGWDLFFLVLFATIAIIFFIGGSITR